MQVEVAEPRQIEHPPGNHASVPHDGDRIRLEGGKLSAELFVALDLFWLRERQTQGQRTLLDGRRCHFHAAPPRPIWRGHDQLHRKPGFDEFVERGHREAWSPAENEMEERRQVKEAWQSVQLDGLSRNLNRVDLQNHKHDSPPP
jgi:hypothetical protein